MSAFAIAISICGVLLLYVSRSDILYLPYFSFRSRIFALLISVWSSQAARQFHAASGFTPDDRRYKIEYIKLIVQSILSIVLTLASVYIMLSPSSTSSDKHWASG